MDYDKTTIRDEAKKDLDQGAVTSDYGLDPIRACEILNHALASEIVCVLRYRHHQIVAKSIHAPVVAEEFEEHATSEEKHILMLAERINQLGGEPNLNPANLAERSVTEYGITKNSLLGMIRDDLVAERIVISLYRQMIQWFGDRDSTTRRMLEQILADEEEHASELADLLALETISQHDQSEEVA
jgi:bacterioferritin